MAHIGATWNDLCGLTSDGTPLCWGPAGAGTNGTGSVGAPQTQLLGLRTSHNIACGMTGSTGAVCWGVFGPGPALPVPSGLIQVAATGGGACGLKQDGSPVCSPALSQPDPLAPMSTIGAGEGFACGLREQDHSVTCWGGENPQDPILTPPPGPFVDLRAYAGSACAIDAAGNLQCWGTFLNDHGQPIPPMNPPGQFVAFGVGLGFGCGILANGTLSCWGDNSEGQASPPPGLPGP